MIRRAKRMGKKGGGDIKGFSAAPENYVNWIRLMTEI